MFDGRTTAQIDWAGPGMVADLSALTGKAMSEDALAAVMVCAGTWLSGAITAPDKVRADVVHEAHLVPMGFTGDERSTRRAVAAAKAAYSAGHRRTYRPWVPEPGMWCQYDWYPTPRNDWTGTLARRPADQPPPQWAAPRGAPVRAKLPDRLSSPPSTPSPRAGERFSAAAGGFHFYIVYWAQRSSSAPLPRRESMPTRRETAVSHPGRASPGRVEADSVGREELRQEIGPRRPIAGGGEPVPGRADTERLLRPGISPGVAGAQPGWGRRDSVAGSRPLRPPRRPAHPRPGRLLSHRPSPGRVAPPVLCGPSP
jgi:hypothetical protein